MANIEHQLQEFVRVTKYLNNLGIVPVLYGSLGLYFVLGVDRNVDDIDILLPLRYLKTDWAVLVAAMADMQYLLQNEREHEFVNQGFKIGFADEESLLDFAKVNYRTLHIAEKDDATFKMLGRDDYLKVYQSALKDDYRQGKKKGADLEKIKMLQTAMLNS